MTELDKKRLEVNDMANRITDILDFILFCVKNSQIQPSLDKTCTEGIHNYLQSIAQPVDELYKSFLKAHIARFNEN